MRANVLTWLGKKQLLRAAARGDTIRLRTLIGRGADPNATDAAGWSALHYTAALGHVESVRTLLRYGADPNVRDRALGYTPLNLAVRDGQAEIAELLLQNGADVRRLHDRLLERAMRNHDTPIALLLRQYGARMAHEPAEADEPQSPTPLPASAPPTPPRTEAHDAPAETEPQRESAQQSGRGRKTRPNGAVSRQRPAQRPAGVGAGRKKLAAKAEHATEAQRLPSPGERARQPHSDAAGPRDPELDAVVHAWPQLSEAMRSAIVSMIEATHPRATDPQAQRSSDPGSEWEI